MTRQSTEPSSSTSSETSHPKSELHFACAGTALAGAGVVLLASSVPVPGGLPAWALAIAGTALAIAGVLLVATKSRPLMRSLHRTGTSHPERMAASVSPALLAHEIRNPLTAALGRLDLMLDDASLRPDQVLAVQTALRGVERAAALISDYMADPEGWQPGGTLKDRAAVDLRPLAHEAMQEYAALATARRVSMSLDVQGDVTVNGNALRLRQLFDNLLANAVKYNEEEGWIDIRLSESTATNDAPPSVLIEITNPGTTLTQESDGSAFEERFRGEGVPEGVPGEGFGLAVVRSIVQAHGGTISLSSNSVSYATQIDVTLPASVDIRQ